MGNCFVLRDKKGADVKKLTIVKDLLRYLGSVGLSKKSSMQHPSSSSLLKLPKTNSVSTNSGPAGQSFSSTTPSAKRRIKVVITKQQLQELLSKQKQQQQVSLGDLLSGFQSTKASSSSSTTTTNHDSSHCKPKLEPIPEENDDCF